MTKINLQDAPAWDFSVIVGGTEFVLLSPMDVDADMAPGPLPDQAAIDAATRRRAGVLRRGWWWVFGDPRRLTPADLPRDGGAEQARLVAAAVVAEGQRGLLGGLKTAEVAALVTTYMSVQGVYYERMGAWAAERARDAMPERGGQPERVPDAVTPLTPSNTAGTIDRLTAVFGPPRRGYATGIVADHGPQDLNGQVYGEGGPR